MADNIQIIPGNTEVDTDALAAKLGIAPLDPSTPVEGTPPSETPPAGDTPPPADPVKPADDTPPPAADPKPKSPNAEAAAKRVAEKTAQAELEAARARVAELEAIANRLPDVERQMTEFKTVAEQRAEALKKHEERFKNEVDHLDPHVVYELPEVKQAQQNFGQVASKFLPVDLSNPADGEPDIRFDRRKLTDADDNAIIQNVQVWEREEYNSQADPHRRASIQHIALSNIAKRIGVDVKHFSPLVIDGTEYNVLSPNHPVYQHLKQSVRPYVEAGLALRSTLNAAQTSQAETMKGVVAQRVGNTKKMFGDAGLGLTGDALKAARAQRPDSPLLQTMELLENDPELLAELKENIEVEAAVNGYYRPVLDLTETDLEARDKAAQTYMARIGQGRINAPIAPVAMKLAAKLQKKLADTEAKLAEAIAERDKFLVNAEAGPSGGGVGDPTGKTADTSGYTEAERKAAERLGIPLS
jgi:hypothetical protein